MVKSIIYFISIFIVTLHWWRTMLR